MTIHTDAVPSSLPDDLNPEIVKATAAFIGQITGLVPPPHDAFPPEWYGYLRTFTARVKKIASENAAPTTQADHIADERKMVAAWRDVLAERERQVSTEGFTRELDDECEFGELADAAACYAHHASMRASGALSGNSVGGFTFWPWNALWWKPTTPRRDLVKAGALILAEIERIDRAASSTGDQEVGS